jgi:hypothetical protein
MSKTKLPSTDSIEALAKFWNTHDLTDFEKDLEAVTEPIFVRAKGTSLSIRLQPTEARHLMKIAQSRGLKESTVVRHWILERLHESSPTARPRHNASPTAQPTRRH